MSGDILLIERRERVALLTLNRPETLNALSLQMMKDLTAACAELDNDPAIGCLVITGSAKAFETPLVQATQLNEPNRDAVAFQFDVPLDSLKPGTYICQINVIDDAGGTFTFPRTAVLIRPAPSATPAPATPAAPGASGK